MRRLQATLKAGGAGQARAISSSILLVIQTVAFQCQHPPTVFDSAYLVVIATAAAAFAFTVACLVIIIIVILDVLAALLRLIKLCP